MEIVAHRNPDHPTASKLNPHEISDQGAIFLSSFGLFVMFWNADTDADREPGEQLTLSWTHLSFSVAAILMPLLHCNQKMTPRPASHRSLF
jgi:hypothetical protein